ncbi:MAG: AgmX/PglI C-terminal domain-containing protein, partial [Bdellovibrionales bacterium]
VKAVSKPQPEADEIKVAPPKKTEIQAQAKPAATLTPDPGLQKQLPKNTGSKPGPPGVLGVLRKGTSGKTPLKADSLVASRPSSALDSDSGTVAVARSNPGALAGGQKGGTNQGVSLDSAGTQLKGGYVTEPGGGGISGSDSGTLGSGAMAGAKASGRGTGLGQGLSSGFASQIEVQGGLDRESVRRAIREYTQQIRTCYNNFLTIVRPKDSNGRVTLSWQIRPTGQVTLNSIKTNTFNDQKLGTCIKGIVDRIQFPKADNGLPTNVVYPFVFQGKSK